MEKLKKESVQKNIIKTKTKTKNINILVEINIKVYLFSRQKTMHQFMAV